MSTQDKLAEALREVQDRLAYIPTPMAASIIDLCEKALQAHAAEVAHTNTYNLDCSLADKIEFALRDAGFPLDEASALSMSLSAQAQAQSGQWGFHDEAYCADREAEIEGIFTAGIDIGECMNRIECHGNSKEAAEELRARIMHAIMSVKE